MLLTELLWAIRRRLKMTRTEKVTELLQPYPKLKSGLLLDLLGPKLRYQKFQRSSVGQFNNGQTWLIGGCRATSSGNSFKAVWAHHSKEIRS